MLYSIIARGRAEVGLATLSERTTTPTRVIPPFRGRPPRSRAFWQSGQSRRRPFAIANPSSPPGPSRRPPRRAGRRLPLCVLVSLPCSLQAVLLALLHARVPAQKAGLLHA